MDPIVENYRADYRDADEETRKGYVARAGAMHLMMQKAFAEAKKALDAKDDETFVATVLACGAKLRAGTLE